MTYLEMLPASDSGGFRQNVSRNYWISKIRALVKSERISVVALARAMHEGRKELGEAEWDAMWRSGQIRFPKRRGELLAALGRELADCDNQISSRLLSQWNVLYEIALLGGSAVVRLRAAGIIRSDLSVSRAAKLMSLTADHTVKRAICRLEQVTPRQRSCIPRNRRVAWAAALRRLAKAVFPEPKERGEF